MSNSFLAGSGAVWIQPDGPNTPLYYLGCHEMGEIASPKGDLNLFYCPDPSRPNKFEVVGQYQSTPGPITTTLTTGIGAVAAWLESIDCAVPVYVAQISCGRKDVFVNYDRLFILDSAVITSHSLSGLAIRTPDSQAESLQTFSISATKLHRIMHSYAAGQRSWGAGARDGLVVSFCGPDRCYGVCGDAFSGCQEGYLGVEGIVGSPSNVYRTNDAGIMWEPTPVNPFIATEDVRGLVTFLNTSSTWKVAAARGVTDAANPAEIAVSDDRGLTWTNYDVGAVNGQYMIGRGDSVFGFGGTRIWTVTTGGYIYTSDDGCQTWTAQQSGTLTTSDLYAIHFADNLHGVAVGEDNYILATTNAGEDWSLITAPAAEVGNTVLGIHMIDNERWWVCYDSARIYYTNDGGTSFRERPLSISGVGSIRRIKFASPYSGWLLHLNAAGTVGTVYHTVNGGYTWELQAMPTGTGPLYDIWPCDCNTAYFAGEF